MALAVRGTSLADVYDANHPEGFLADFQAHIGPLRGAPAAAAGVDLTTPMRNMGLGDKETPKGGRRARGTPASGAAS
jgi:hypothetical protein